MSHLFLSRNIEDGNTRAGATPSPSLVTWPPFVVSGAGAGQNMVFALEETGGGWGYPGRAGLSTGCV
eukprot:COSAG01_NODE_2603_length_7393_cov_39.196874_7_plen_67_part_00